MAYSRNFVLRSGNSVTRLKPNFSCWLRHSTGSSFATHPAEKMRIGSRYDWEAINAPSVSGSQIAKSTLNQATSVGTTPRQRWQQPFTTGAPRQRHCGVGTTKSYASKDTFVSHAREDHSLCVCLEVYIFWTQTTQPSLSVANKSQSCAGFYFHFYWVVFGDEALITVFKHRFRPRGNTARGGS